MPQISAAKRRLCSIQRRLQPLRFASPAWQARRANGSAESAPTLPLDARAQSVSWESMRLPSQCHSRSRRPCSLLRAAARFENLGSSDSAVIDSRYKAAQDRLAEILTAACAAREELLPESAIHRPASRRRGQRVVNSIHEDALREIH